jgi:hypothetical protein
VFQANPRRFDLLQALQEGGTEAWSVNQHRQDIQPGDRVWFRLTGPDAGIYAVGQVTSVPRPEASEFGDWQVDVTFESRIDPPLLRAESDADPVLSSASALAGLMGTNLALPAETDIRLEEVTEDRLIPVGGREPPARLLAENLIRPGGSSHAVSAQAAWAGCSPRVEQLAPVSPGDLRFVSDTDRRETVPLAYRPREPVTIQVTTAPGIASQSATRHDGTSRLAAVTEHQVGGPR